MCLRRWVLSRWVSPNSPKAKGGGPSCLPMFEDVAGNTHGCYTVIAAQGDFAKAGAAGLSVQVSVEQRASPNSLKTRGGGASCLPLCEDVAGNSDGCYTLYIGITAILSRLVHPSTHRAMQWFCHAGLWRQ